MALQVKFLKHFMGVQNFRLPMPIGIILHDPGGKRPVDRVFRKAFLEHLVDEGIGFHGPGGGPEGGEDDGDMIKRGIQNRDIFPSISMGVGGENPPAER
jgi:hypothetical protein